LDDVINGSAADAVLSRQMELPLTRRHANPNSRGGIVADSAVSVPFPPRYVAVAFAVVVVLLVGSPIQIRYLVVESVAVLVGADVARWSIGPRTNESPQDELMQLPTLPSKTVA
jgi:hypothetical protein